MCDFCNFSLIKSFVVPTPGGQIFVYDLRHQSYLIVGWAHCVTGKKWLGDTYMMAEERLKQLKLQRCSVIEPMKYTIKHMLNGSL